MTEQVVQSKINDLKNRWSSLRYRFNCPNCPNDPGGCCTVTNERNLDNICDARLELDFWNYVQANYYYDNNFNEFSRAMVVLMDLIIVNQWHVIMEQFVLLTSKWARLYFIIFYFSSVVVVMNVLTAFVLEAFISQYSKRKQDEEPTSDFEFRVNHGLKLLIPNQELQNEWKVHRRLSKAVFYIELFPDIEREVQQQQNPNGNTL